MRFVYSAIGSRVQFFFGLISSIERLIFYNWLICSFICFTYLILVTFCCYWLISFHLDFWENFFINPINSFGLENSKLISYEAFKINSALLIHLAPFNKLKFLPKDNYFNSYLIRYSSFNHHIKDNSEISKNILNKDLSKFIGGGYTSYKNIEPIGFINDLLNNKKLLIKKISNYLATLEIDKTYTILPIIRWINDDTGLSNSITVSESLKINKLVDKELLANIFYKDMLKSAYKYNVINNNSEFMLMNRV